jgi:AmmeMemoRadiSam system protein B
MSLTGEQTMIKDLGVRPSPIAGTWYPADPKRLSALIDGYINALEVPPIDEKVLGIMVPHAGIIYSGPVAAAAFSLLRGLTPEVVAVISPMHYPTWEPLITTAHSAYATPLGTIPVDHELLELLDERLDPKLGYQITRMKNDPEHSLEIELPFLQRVLKSDFKILPIMVRDPSPAVVKPLGEALGEVLAGKSAILVASTDLSHQFTQTEAVQLDGEVLKQVENLDPEGVLRTEEEGKGFACGRGALAAVIWAVLHLGANKARILKHATSGDITGNYQEVVGYAAAVFTSPTKESSLIN